jgi:DNA-directed RNA polymerase delta subunit
MKQLIKDDKFMMNLLRFGEIFDKFIREFMNLIDKSTQKFEQNLINLYQRLDFDGFYSRSLSRAIFN